MPHKLRIGVVSGGMSSEREVSLKSGAQVRAALSREFLVTDLRLSPGGEWLSVGRKSRRLRVTGPRNDLLQFDAIFLALHGKYGEDGRVQSLLELAGVPYTGSGVLASALAMDKQRTMEALRDDMSMPKWIALKKLPVGSGWIALHRQILRFLRYPCVVKPNEAGSSVGVTIAGERNEMEKAVREAFCEDKAVLVQEFIRGREVTCGVLGNSDQTELLALPPVEIKTGRRFFDYDAKYSAPDTQEICPAPLSKREAARLSELAKIAHRRLGCAGLTRSDFIFSKGTFYFLETNTIPGLTEASLCPKEARAAGIPFPEFLARQIRLALLRFGKK